MRLLISLFFSFSCFISCQALAESADTLEVNFRENPQQLYQTITEAIPHQQVFSSRDALHQAALGSHQGDDELFTSLYFLARLNLEARVDAENKLEAAKSLRDSLLVTANNDFQHAAALNIDGRYAGRIDHQYTDTISLNEQALNYIRTDKSARSLALKFAIYDDMGVVNLMTKRNEAALNNFKQMHEAAVLLRNPYLIAEAESRLAKYYRTVEQLSQALQHYIEANRAANEQKQPYQTAMLELNIAKLYRDMEQWDEALAHIHKAIDLFRAQGSHKYLSSSMTVIAIIYARQGQWNKAIDYYLNAQQFDAKYQSLTFQALNFHNLGEAYFHINNDKKALEYLSQANRIFTEKKSNHYLVYNELLLAEVFAHDNQMPQSLAHAEKGLALAKQLDLKDEQIEALKYLVQSQQAKGMYAEALSNQQTMTRLTQALLDEAKTTETPSTSNDLSEQNMTLKIQQQRTELQRQQHMLTNRNVVIGFLFITLIVLGTLILYQARKRQQQLLEQQQMLAITHIDAMFALPGYHAFFEEFEHKKKASIALLQFKELTDIPMTRGLFAATAIQQDVFKKLKFLCRAQVYSIGPGQFALLGDIAINTAELHQRLRSINIDGEPLRLDLAAINLPLLADKDVVLPTEVMFETLQWMLFGAASTDIDTGCHLEIKVLEFTPSTVFSQPLYLQLAQGVRRGFIRIDSNAAKDSITWPRFQPLDTSDSANIL